MTPTPTNRHQLLGCVWEQRATDAPQWPFGRITPRGAKTRVCESVSMPLNPATHWQPSFFPSTAALLRIDPYAWLRNGKVAELGLSHRRLPVTHRWTTKPSAMPRTNTHHRDENGVWFYYARGCSDLYYDVGRTLAANNKAEAAIKLAAQANGTDQPERWVADFLRAGPFSPGPGHFKPRYANALALGNVSLEAVLRAAAFGPFALGQKRSQRYASAPFCNTHFMRMSGGGSGAKAWLTSFLEKHRKECVGPCALAELSAALVLFEFLDPYLIAAGRTLGLDSIQLLLQPQGGYTFYAYPGRWSVEILDLRTAHLNSRAVEERPDELLPHLFGVPAERQTIARQPAASKTCQPACWFSCCMACRDTPIAMQTCLKERLKAGALVALSQYPRNATSCLLPHGPAECSLRNRSTGIIPSVAVHACRRPMVTIPLVSFCASECALGDVGATKDVLEASQYLAAIKHGFWPHQGTATRYEKRHPPTCEAEAVDRNRKAAIELQRKFNEGEGIVMHVLPCSFEHSRFARHDLSTCVRESLHRSHTAASLLRRDLPNAIYTGGRLGGNIGGSRRTPASENNEMWIEPHVGERVNTDVGYDSAIGWLFNVPPAERRGGAFPHDAWVEELAPISGGAMPRGGSRVQCEGHRPPSEYANARFEYFHQRGRPSPWKPFVYGGGRGPSVSRAAWLNCYHQDWKHALHEQQQYVERLARHQADIRRHNSSPPHGRMVGTEAEFGSGFCFSYNQVHLSWGPADIVGIFYVNDTLTPSMATDLANRASARNGKDLADDTKLLPRAARSAGLTQAQANSMAKRLQALSLERAARAYANALQVQKWMRNPPWLQPTVAPNGTILLDDSIFAHAYHRRTEPLPVLQWRVSSECFDMEAALLRMRARRVLQSDIAKPTWSVLEEPSEPPPAGSCVSRTHSCSFERDALAP